VNLPESARALIGDGADATLVTLNADGSPQISVVWVKVEPGTDGDEIVSAHLAEYRKTRNVRRDPRVALTILAAPEAGRQRTYLSIQGTARIVEGGAPERLTSLAEALLGSSEHFPPKDAPAGLLTRIRIDKIGGDGPWAS
jgi:PPOX class probable F420-dependent enzyme